MIIVSNLPNKRLALFIVALGSFMMPYMGSAINIALPSIGIEFSVDVVLLNWVVTSYFLASVMFLIPFGKIADMYGRKKIFTYGFIIFMVASILSAISTSVIFLIIFRFLMGIGGAMFLSTGVAIIASVSPVVERGKALGVNAAIVFLGQSVGPPLGGVLTEHFGWRSIFYANVPICILVLFLIFWKLEGESREAKIEKFNYASSIIYSISFLLIMYGFSIIPDKNSYLFTLAGVISFLYFIWRETKIKKPLIDINLFRKNRVFAFSNLALLINHSAIFAVVFILSLYLQYIKMLSPQSAGLVLITKTIVQFIFSPIAGSLSDRIDSKKITTLGMGLIAVALFLFAFLNSQTSLVFIFFVLTLLGFGIGIFSAPNTNAIMGSVGKEHFGVSSATIATMRQTGNLLSMVIVMLIFALSIGKVEITPQYHGIFLKATRSSFIVYGLLCSCGVFFSITRGQS